jgi:hypothetical protein
VSPRDRGGHEPRDRRPAVHQAQHRRLPPTQSVPQAPSQIPACMPPIITPPRCSSSPPARGGEQSLPPRSAATKSARARGLADLIDNLGAALPAAAVFLSTARVAAKYPSAGDLLSCGGATFGRLPQRRGLRGKGVSAAVRRLPAGIGTLTGSSSAPSTAFATADQMLASA